jgi:hypothetical protein
MIHLRAIYPILYIKILQRLDKQVLTIEIIKDYLFFIV